MKYILETPIRGTIGPQKFASTIYWRNGIFIADEPEKIGGKDLGPDPYTLLLSSLVGCTLATLRMYIEHKGLIIPEVEIEANLFFKIKKNGPVATIERKIAFRDPPDLAIQERLLDIADKCPISQLLKGNINISTELKK